MFVHETHCYYIMITMKKTEALSESCASKKKECLEKALSNIGAEALGNGLSVWMLNDVMYSSSEDVFDIINSELIRLVSSDNALAQGDKKSCLLDKDSDKIIVSEYIPDNTYVF